MSICSNFVGSTQVVPDQNDGEAVFFVIREDGVIFKVNPRTKEYELILELPTIQ